MKTMRQDRLSFSALRLVTALAGAWVLAYRIVAWLDDKVEKRRSRRLLQELSDHQLKDIGISRADAFEEGRRPFWD